MNYEIRKCRKEDLPDVVELCKQHAKFERATYQPVGKVRRLSKTLFDATPILFCWILVVENEIAGYATFTFDYSTWETSRFLYMDCLFIKNKFRGLGLGKQIMIKLIQHAKQKKCVNVQWQTPEFNNRAVKFYNRIG